MKNAATQRRRQQREHLTRESAQKFRGCCALWELDGGPGEGLDWLAAHVGRIVAEVAILRRDVARLERRLATQRRQPS